MGYIAAVLNKKGEDTSETILRMLRTASKSPALSYGIADHMNTEINRSTDFTSHSSPILLASKNIFPEVYPPEPLHQGNHSLVFNGILLDTEEPDSLAAANTLMNEPVKGIEKLIAERTGAYVVAAATKNSIVAGVDYNGTIPLYYGENIDNRAIASNRKMLWAIGIEPAPLKPGSMIKITENDTTITQIKTLKNPDQSITTAETLHKIMNQTTKEYAVKTPRATVAFSGGIDSLLTAHYLQQNNVRLELVWAGLEDQPEQTIAEEAANHLELRLHACTFSLDDVEKILDNVIESIEEPDPLKTGIAYPFHWAAEKTYDLGYTTLYSGNGADEVFAGYMRYLDKYLGGEDPSKDIYNDVINSYLQNFHRDTKTCIDQNTRLLLPFTHPRLIEFGLSIPINQKLPQNRDEPRKKILRELAKNQGISAKLADRPKKAAQYSSGVNKALSTIAKKQGVNLRELVTRNFQKVKGSISRG